MLNLNHLYYFYLTHKMGGMTKAASFLRVSQSSLSVQTKALEQFFGVALSYKVGRQLALTEDGEKVYGYAEKIFSIADELTQNWKSAKSSLTKRLIIGVSPQVERPFVANLMAPLLKDLYPRTILEVVSGEEKDLRTKLEIGAIDLLLTNSLIYSENISALVMLEIPVKLYLSTKLAKEIPEISKMSVKDILRKSPHALVLPHENLLLRFETDSYMKTAQMTHPAGFISDLLSVIERAIIEGAGMAFLPEIYMRAAVQQKLVMAFGKDEGLWKHRLVLLARKQGQNSPLFEKVKVALVELVKKK